MKNQASDALSRVESECEEYTDISGYLSEVSVDLNDDANEVSEAILCVVPYAREHIKRAPDEMVPEVRDFFQL